MKAPHAEVKERFGSKEKLADEVFKLLDKPEEESKEDFKARIGGLSNRKLLHLLQVAGDLKGLGGREKVVGEILAAHKREKDGDWKNALLALRGSQLLDRHRAAKKLEKRGGKIRGQAPLALHRSRRKNRRKKLLAGRKPA